MVIIIEKCEGGVGVAWGRVDHLRGGPPSEYRGGPPCPSKSGWWCFQVKSREWSDPAQPQRPKTSTGSFWGAGVC